jgi:hypothetical protein
MVSLLSRRIIFSIALPNRFGHEHSTFLALVNLGRANWPHLLAAGRAELEMVVHGNSEERQASESLLVSKHTPGTPQCL